MIRINLLPYRAARKKENIRRQVSIFILSLIVVALLMFWYNTILGVEIEALNEQITGTRAQVTKYTKINAEIAEIRKKLTLLERKIKVIESLEANRKAPAQNLDTLYLLLVEKRMWYTQIEEKGETFKLSGVAMDTQTVADYMMRVEKADRFENVRLAAIKKHKIKGRELGLKQFDLNFDKKPVARAATEVEQNGS